VSPLELVDDRFEQLSRELRASRPVASVALRARVRALEPPPPPRLPELNLRRLVPALALTAVAVSASVAVGIGLVRGGSKPAQRGALARPAAVAPATSVEQQALRGAGSDKAFHPLRLATPSPGSVPSDRQRLQQYDAVLKARVDNHDELSARTGQTMRLTRTLGGYVASAVYDVPGKRGASALVLRIPIDRVQQALEAFSAYGTLVSQRISVRDVQRRVDGISSSVEVLRKEVATIERQLARPVTPARRAELERRLAFDRRRIEALTRTRQAITRRAQLARVVLTLVTPRSHAAAAPGRFARTLDDAGSVLARELELVLYALVVIGPLVALGAAGIAASRVQRRRSDRRLLERA
jgi:Domain of unknown function (DUF4349)